jgi:hypothetical protein
MKMTTAVMAIALAVASHAGGQAWHTHWEPYKYSATPPSVDQELVDPVLGAIDLHAHYRPDAYPRQWDAFEIAALAQQRGALGGIVEITAGSLLRAGFKHNPAHLLGLEELR